MELFSGHREEGLRQAVIWDDLITSHRLGDRSRGSEINTPRYQSGSGISSFLAAGILLVSVTLSEDVFDDTMPHCEKLYNADSTAIAFSWIGVISLPSGYYQSLW